MKTKKGGGGGENSKLLLCLVTDLERGGEGRRGERGGGGINDVFVVHRCKSDRV